MDLYRLTERAMAMDDRAWARHANPWSVFSRFAILPLFALAVWSRVWIGWGAAVPVLAVLVFTFVNPRLFAPVAGAPRGWAGKGTAGERLWLDRRTRPVPERHVAICHVLAGLGGVGMAVLLFGLWHLDPGVTLAGLVLSMGSKAWFVDRMVWLHEDMIRTGPQDSA
ncbi:hypothetical protein ATO6_08715 [Oceanicola sp. 22II-s10i]|uniref:DUF6653 family protein n=1 Tax=Oceanicola sp. 22II-s10i TaxID=1317116 RepID=UPI000B528D34|nr:DUF6653 family protein [Oceanicola sp. 22II-s10i]OWU85116.1 hypothetical protein ATO6_08715 [Oceanicola sp. 22II-s10i]